jgi:hypothetical protein
MEQGHVRDDIVEVCDELGFDRYRFETIEEIVLDRIDLLTFLTREFLTVSQTLLTEKDKKMFFQILHILRDAR